MIAASLVRTSSNITGFYSVLTRHPAEKMMYLSDVPSFNHRWTKKSVLTSTSHDPHSELLEDLLERMYLKYVVPIQHFFSQLHSRSEYTSPFLSKTGILKQPWMDYATALTSASHLALNRDLSIQGSHVPIRCLCRSTAPDRHEFDKS
jgi:hypothetical protein